MSLKDNPGASDKETLIKIASLLSMSPDEVAAAVKSVSASLNRSTVSVDEFHSAMKGVMDLETKPARPEEWFRKFDKRHDK